MALLPGGIAPNLLLGLAGYKRPGLLGQVQQQQNLLAQQTRQAEEDRRRRAMEDFKMQQMQRQAQGMERAQGLMSFDPSSMPGAALPQGQIDRQLGGALLQGGQVPAAMGLLAPKPQEGFTLSPGQTRFGAGGQEIASLAEKVNPEDKAKEKALNFKQEKELRGEYTQATKTFADINNAFGRIKVSAAEPSAAGDLSLIFNYMKMLDPESVVRESEFALAAASGSLGERWRAIGEKLATGQRLAPGIRADFLDRSKKLYDEAAKIHSGRKNEFKRLAEANKLDPQNVVFNMQFYGLKPDDGKFKPIGNPPGRVIRQVK